MKKFQNKYRIPSARAQWWNYADDGAYFITICTAHMECYFGEITDSVMVLSELGEIVQKFWLEIPEHFSYVKLDTFVVMPNHFHGIIIIDKPANQNNLAGTPDNVIMPDNIVETPNLGVSTDTTPVKCGGKNENWHKGVLGVVINQFKRKCTIECRKFNTTFGWQSRFYDTIIRDQESYNTISKYIVDNPTKWKDDKLHPSKKHKDMETDNLSKQVSFIKEIDKIKYITRKTKLFNSDRPENDAEHSWHLAMMTIVLAEHADTPIDVLKVLKMVLIHDIVEIDAGDTFIYDTTKSHTNTDNERIAAKRIFGLLPKEQADELIAIWEEFEAGVTNDAKFAKSMDRFEPLLQNTSNDGGTWREFDVDYDQVYKKKEVIKAGSTSLWNYAKNLINESVDKGILKKKKS